MKKLCYFLFAAALCVGFVGCSEDKDKDSGKSSKSLIVGTWELYKDYDVNYDEYYYYDDPCYFQFKSNGTGYHYHEGESKGDWFEFEWNIEDSKLYIEEEDGDWFSQRIKELNNKEMILVYEEYDEQFLEYYRRIN